MVGKKTLKDYELTSLDDYFNMTLNSRIYGQLKQAKNQFKKMDKGQKIEFLEFVRINAPEEYNFFINLI